MAPATIQVGQQVPLINGVTYDSFGNSHNSIQYTGIGVILRVTPFITEDGLVEMIVSPQISQLDPGAGIPISANANGTGTINAPIIDIRQADTVAVTPDGQTVALAESLSDELSANVRLGLVSATAAAELARLQRCNQDAVLRVITRRGLTTRQTSRLVEALLAAPQGDWPTLLEQAMQTSARQERKGGAPRRTPGEQLVALH